MSETREFFKGGDLNPGERHSRDTRDDGTVTLCTLRAATVLSRDCRADFGRRLTKKVMSHSRDCPGVTAPSRTNIVPLTGVGNTPPSVTPPLKSAQETSTEKQFSESAMILGPDSTLFSLALARTFPNDFPGAALTQDFKSRTS